MSLIGLIDVDSHNFPNLPLMKLSAWHKAQGDDVEWWNGLKNYEIVYKSKVFDFTQDENHCITADKIIMGGTGYDLVNALSDEIEHTYPDYTIYPNLTADTAFGFLTRGCPRNCQFCIVSQKEGHISKKVADLNEFYQGQKNIKLLDPNLLACKGHMKLLEQLVKSGAWIDFTQGLDIRLINSENIELINKCKIKILHFAWDNPNEDLTRYFERFKKASNFEMRKLSVYVLTNFNTIIEQDLYRIYKLKEMGFDPYVMVYDKINAQKEVKRLQRWVNNKCIFRSCSKFEEYRP